MNSPRKVPAPASMSIGDILYVIFRHKWKIITISILGTVAALLLPVIKPIPFESEAKLFIKYVLENKSPTQVASTDAAERTVAVGDSVIGTELEILSSLDLALDVVDEVGPEILLLKPVANPEDARLGAAGMVKKGLLAETKRGNVIRLTFQHPKRTVVQPILTKIVEIYLKRHTKMHGELGDFDKFLNSPTEDLKTKLGETEQALHNELEKAGVVSFDDNKRLYATQLAKIREEMFEAQADLDARRALVKELTRMLATNTANTAALPIETVATTNVPVPLNKVEEYRKICRLLETLEKREDELLLVFTPTTQSVTNIQNQIANNRKTKEKLERDHPELLQVAVSGVKPPVVDPAAKARADLMTETANLSALESRINSLSNQMEMVRAEARAFGKIENTLAALQREKQMHETNLFMFSASKEKARIDEAISAGRVWNITDVQKATPPVRAASKIQKLMAGVFVGSIALAFGLAFLIELYIDNSIKRPVDVEHKVGLKVFMSVPLLGGRNGSRGLEEGRPPLLLLGVGERRGKSGAEENGKPVAGVEVRMPEQLEVPSWDENHFLRPFCEGLRDRLITHFEVTELHRKPKLVGVTACAEGAGVSSIAAGLAASLSETGEGNVLLVDMNQKNGAAHDFYRGQLTLGLDDALRMEKREDALVQERLYVVSEKGAPNDKLARALPYRFSNLVPRLKASDYDYIIFDLPPVSETSVTPRLARFMDMALMVVESGKTGTEVAKRANALLQEAKANVGVVLNKTKSYVPKSLNGNI